MRYLLVFATTTLVSCATLGPTDDPVAAEASCSSALKASAAETEALCLEAVRVTERSAPHSPEHIRSLHALASHYMGKSDFAGARPLLLQKIEIQRATLGPDHPDVAKGLLLVTGTFHMANDFAGGERYIQEAVAIVVRTNAPAEQQLPALSTLTQSYVMREKWGEAAPLQDALVAAQEKVTGPDSVKIVSRLETQALILTKLGRRAETFAPLERAIRIRSASQPPGAEDLLGVRVFLLNNYLAEDRFAEARGQVQALLSVAEAANNKKAVDELRGTLAALDGKIAAQAKAKPAR